MKNQLHKYLHAEQQVEIIYIDRHGITSQRTVRLLGIKGGSLKAYCLTKKAPRVFLIENILAAYPSSNKSAI